MSLFFDRGDGEAALFSSSTIRYVLDHPLNRGSRLAALTRYVRWQIGSRIAPGEIVFPWVEGARVIVRPGDRGFTQNIYCGLQDFRDMGYLLHVLRPDDLFVDVGANVGSYTILACAVKGARGYCFEPIPGTYRRLMDNIAINSLGSRVLAFNVGIAEKDGELVFTSEQDSGNHVAVAADSEAAQTTVQVRTLDSMLGEANPAAIKIDVEGFEPLVLDGANRTLSSASLHSVIMEVNGPGCARYGFDEVSIFRRMQALGFQSCDYDPFSREIQILDGNSPLGGNNGLFIRNPELVSRIVRDAPKIRLGGMSF